MKEYAIEICAIVSKLAPLPLPDKPIVSPFNIPSGAVLEKNAYQNLNPKLSDPTSHFFLPFPPAPIGTLTAAKLDVWYRFQLKKESVQQISSDPNNPRKPDTIQGYLASAISAGFPVDIDRIEFDVTKLQIPVNGSPNIQARDLRAMFPGWTYGETGLIAAILGIRFKATQGFAGEQAAPAPAALVGAPKPTGSVSAVINRPVSSLLRSRGSQENLKTKPVKHKGNALLAESDEEPDDFLVNRQASNIPTSSQAIEPGTNAVVEHEDSSDESIDLLDPEPGGTKRARTEDDAMQVDNFALVSEDQSPQPQPKRVKTDLLLFPAVEEDPLRMITQLPDDDLANAMEVDETNHKLEASPSTVLAFLCGAKSGATRAGLALEFCGDLDGALRELAEGFRVYSKDGKYFRL